jgi:branched-chain amino acid transport system ATP-binding protein
MAERKSGRNRDYSLDGADVVMAVDAVAREAQRLAEQAPDLARLESLVTGAPMLALDQLHAGYGNMEIVHGLNLRVGKGQALCLIGPNGAGKSTVLHSIYGFSTIISGRVIVDGNEITRLSPNRKLKEAGVAYILQDNSVFPEMTVEENLWMGGFLKTNSAEAKASAERVFQRHPHLAERRHQPARVLSGGERRLLEINRALVMNPQVLLVDEPSIGLEPRYIDMVFEIFAELREREGKTIVMVEQNAKKGLEFADIGYVLVSGQLAIAGPGRELLEDPAVVRLFLGG